MILENIDATRFCHKLIIHILDQDDEYHINSFDIEIGSTGEVQEFITAFINREKLEDSMSIFK